MAAAQVSLRPAALTGSYERPSSAKLAGVKFELYHPNLPSLRRMSMDDITRKLSSQHSRSSTTCEREEFATARTMIPVKCGSIDSTLHCRNTLCKETDEMMKVSQPIKSWSYTDNWRVILERLNTVPTFFDKYKQAATQTDSLQLQISGLTNRNTHPTITGSWQAVESQSNGQMYRPSSGRPMTPKQMPATMYSRYRGSRSFSANPWK